MIDATGPICRNLVSVAPGSDSLKQCGNQATIRRDWVSVDIEALWGANLPADMCDQCDSDRYRPRLSARHS